MTTFSPQKTLHGNFTMGEVVKSATAIRLGIDNIPKDDDVWDRARETAEHILQPPRDHWDIPYSPESWFRCEALEWELCRNTFLEYWMPKHGYAPAQREEAWQVYFSRKSHPLGEAADHEIPGVSNHDLYAFHKANTQFDQLIAEFMKQDDPTAGWVHGSHRSTGNRRQAFDIG